MRRRWNGLVAAILAVVLAATACSSGDERGRAGPRREDRDETAADDGSEHRGTTSPGGPGTPPRPSSGCSAPRTEPAELRRAEVSVHGTMREYFVTTPGGTAPLPLVVDLHGLMEGAELHASHTRLGEHGLRNGFVTVFPNGRGEPLRWDARAGVEDNEDLELVDAVVARVAARRCIDLARVYATGLSNGAMLASLLACERSATFAAVAPVAGLVAPEPCDPDRAVPILSTHGTADPIVGFNGSTGGLDDALAGTPTTTEPPADLAGPGHPAALAEWARRNGCAPNATDERVATSVVHRRYDCPEGAEVSSYLVEGGGHAWPGSRLGESFEAVTGPVTGEIDWNELAWEFFQRHALP